MTPVYVDTGILAKLYTFEANSALAVKLIQEHSAPLPLTEWQELELRNALRLKMFRREVDENSLQISLEHFDADIASGRWQRPSYWHEDVFARAESLSADYARMIGCRSLDILHVAAALVIGAQSFLTFDLRQAELARQAGLDVRIGQAGSGG